MYGLGGNGEIDPRISRERMNAPVRFSSGIPDADYPIVVGLDIASELAEIVAKEASGMRVAIISDENVGTKWGHAVQEALSHAGVQAELFIFPAGEQNKNQVTVSALQGKLLQKRYGRDTLVIALGGGVVGDVAGYVAATFLRGVPFLQMPTTLLAMVDSSIGGKVGVDTEHGKNTIGAFWQPRAVVTDLRYLESLSEREIVSGLLEAVKSFMTSDRDALQIVESIHTGNPLTSAEALQEVVVRAVRFKCGVVARDEREENERRILNFGHTVGHAVEVLSGYTMPHGFAVGYGILVETKIAENLGVLSSADRTAVMQYLLRFGITPDGLKGYDVTKVIDAMKGDKKARAGSIYCVLLNGIGSVSTEGGQFAHPIDEAIISKAYRSLVI